MIRIKWLFLCGLLLNVGQTWAVCPNLTWWDLRPNSNVVSRVNIPGETIYFCRDYIYRDASHFTLNLTKQELIGNTDGVKAIGLGTYNKSISIGTGSVTIEDNMTYVNPLRTLPSKQITTQDARPYGEPGFYHFYIKKRASSCSADKPLYRKLRDLLRGNASSIFQASNSIRTFSASPYGGNGNTPELAKISNAELSNSNGDTLSADLVFFWEQYRRSGNPAGGSVGSGGRTYCHFAVAVDVQIKTDSSFDLSRAGDYTIDVGVKTIP